MSKLGYLLLLKVSKPLHLVMHNVGSFYHFCFVNSSLKIGQWNLQFQPGGLGKQEDANHISPFIQVEEFEDIFIRSSGLCEEYETWP